MLFFYNQHNAWVCGLDPRYLSEAGADFGKLYENITEGKQEHAGQIISKRFGARYVVADNSNDEFIKAAQASGDFETVYSDPNALVLHVR